MSTVLASMRVRVRVCARTCTCTSVSRSSRSCVSRRGGASFPTNLQHPFQPPFQQRLLPFFHSSSFVSQTQRCVATLPGSSESSDPDTSSEAIERGMALFAAGEPAPALALFQKAFELPGSGTLRDRKKPREMSIGEVQSAYYNMACCFSALGNEYDKEGLQALQASFKAGFDDFDTLRIDPDIKRLRDEAADFESLMKLYEPQGFAKAFGKQAIKNSALGRTFGWK